MDENSLSALVKDYLESAENHLEAGHALLPELAGMRFFGEPLYAFARAGDPLFQELKKEEVIGSHFLLPEEWLSGAETVVSIFLPFTERVREANRKDMSWPAKEWLHARIEGQAFILNLCAYLQDAFINEGYRCVVPASDSRFSRKSPVYTDKAVQGYYTSNWSERHAAYICGLGSFGLSRGLITSKGIAGRFASLITDCHFKATGRAYSGLYDYCSKCGACARNCPAQAISMETGKSHPVCSAFVEMTREKHSPRFGCGKCQVRVPCEQGIPVRSR
ncbi:4Fe-4S binding protein [Treponema sp. OttesenSCG-928-L16]|nr:4Fe-4S binding protein [Treponema sp. OttesenSCG-928-L16]